MINQSLITWPFLNQSMPKSNDFQILIECICQVSGELIKSLSSYHPDKLTHLKKDIFGHVTSLIGRNVTAAYSKKIPRATAYTCQI